MRLGQILKKWRLVCDLSIRDAAEQIGIGASTLLRIERGKAPDPPTFLIILRWMMEPDSVEAVVAEVANEVSKD